MFAKNECNFIILDTCTLLHHGHLIVRILISIWKNKLNFQLVIPKIVIIELKAQQVYLQDKAFENHNWICVNEEVVQPSRSRFLGYLFVLGPSRSIQMLFNNGCWTSYLHDILHRKMSFYAHSELTLPRQSRNKRLSCGGQSLFLATYLFHT